MTNETSEIGLEMMALGRAARAAASELATSGREQRDLALRSAAEALRSGERTILTANALDLTAAQKAGMSSAMLDRLMLDHERIEAMANGLESIAALPDPVGRILAEWDRPNGLNIQRVAVPLDDLRPGVGRQQDVRIAGFALEEDDEITVEIEPNLTPEDLRTLPEFADVSGG